MVMVLAPESWSIGKILHQRCHCAPPIHAAIGVESGVFGGDNSLNQRGRDLRERRPYATAFVENFSQNTPLAIVEDAALEDARFGARLIAAHVGLGHGSEITVRSRAS